MLKRACGIHNFRGIAILLTLVAVAGCSKPAPEEMFGEGMKMMGQGNFVAARHRFEKILEDNPDFEYAEMIRIAIADCYNQEGRMDDARAIYEDLAEAGEVSEQTWMANVRLGDMARVEEEWEAAEKYFNAAIESTTSSHHQLQAKKNIAESLLAADEFDRAVETYREIGRLSEKQGERLQTAQFLANLFFSKKMNEEAWAAITEVYEASYTPALLKGYLTSVMQTSDAMKEHERGSAYFDELIQGVTDPDRASLIEYYKAHLACTTEVFRATGVALLKALYDNYPETLMGRWASADAAMIILDASDEFPNAIEDASASFAEALSHYDDIVRDMTTAWYFPEKAIGAWRQIARINEMRGMSFEEIGPIRSASEVHTHVIEEFRDILPGAAQASGQDLARLSYMVSIHDASPDKFWSQVRAAKAGRVPQPATPEETAATPGELEVNVEPEESESPK